MNQAFRTNKKELLLSFSFILIGMVLLVLFYYIGKNKYISNQNKRINKILTNNNKVDFLIIGSSHAGAILPEFVRDREQGYHLTSGGRDLFETEYVIKSMLPNLPNLKEVFISVSYFSFLSDNALSQSAAKRRELYSNYPLIWGFIKGDLRYFIQGFLYPLITVDHWEKCWNQLWGIDDTVVINPEANVKRCGSALALDNSASKVSGYFVASMENMSQNHKNLFEDSYEATRGSIQILLKHGIRTIFFTPPYWHTFNEGFPQKYKTLMSSAMRKLTQQYPIEFYDFSHDPSFCFQPNYFFNSDHLDDKYDGKKLFSEKFGAVTRQNSGKRHVFHTFLGHSPQHLVNQQETDKEDSMIKDIREKTNKINN